MSAHPVILAAVENVVQLRIDSLGVFVEDCRPIEARKAIREPQRLGHAMNA